MTDGWEFNGISGDFFFDRRTADLETVPYFLATSALTLSTGNMYPVLCKAYKSGISTQVRAIIRTQFVGATDVKLAVWSSDGQTILAQTLNVATEWNAVLAAAMYVGSWSAPFTYQAGQWYYMGPMVLGNSAGQVGGIFYGTGAMVQTPLLSTGGRISTGQAWAGGAVTTFSPSANGSANIPAIQAIP